MIIKYFKAISLIFVYAFFNFSCNTKLQQKKEETGIIKRENADTLKKIRPYKFNVDKVYSEQTKTKYATILKLYGISKKKKEKKIIYEYNGSTGWEFGEKGHYKKNGLNYYAVNLYDIVAGRQKLLLFNYKDSTLLLSNFFDDSAMGDGVCFDKVDFNNKTFKAISEINKKEYTVSLNYIDTTNNSFNSATQKAQ